VPSFMTTLRMFVAEPDHFVRGKEISGVTPV
jgi:hypothetical protein